MTLHWGTFASCLMIARSVDVTIELFDVDGTPLRATVSLALGQYQPEAGQGTSQWTNPTTRATQARRAHHVQAGDSVHLIAHRHLRDPARWRAIAEFNELDDPLRLHAGDVLVVPMEET
jgi:nucleoid-associated protein YgaU